MARANPDFMVNLNSKFCASQRYSLMRFMAIASVWLLIGSYSFAKPSKLFIQCADTLPLYDLLECSQSRQSLHEVWVYRSFPKPNQQDTLGYLYVGVQDSIDVFFFIDSSHLVQLSNGKLVEASSRDFHFLDFFEIPILQSTDSIRVLFRFKNQFPVPRKMTSAILFLSQESFRRWGYTKREEEGQTLFLLGAFQGLMFAFIIFPFALFCLDPKPYYLYYIAYIIFVVLDDQVAFERFTNLGLWFSARSQSFIHFLNLFQGIAILSYVAFFRQFLNLKEKIIWLDRLLRGLLAYCILILGLDFVVSVLGGFNYQNHLFFWLTRIPPAVMALLSAIMALRLRTLDSVFIGLGVFCWMFGAGLAFMVSAGLLPPLTIGHTTFNPYMFIHLGVLVELTFFSLAMGFRNQQHIVQRQTAEFNLQYKETLHLNHLRRISMDLHDEVGSLLSSISILGEATLQQLPTGMSKERLGIISARAREVMDMMGDIVWSVNPSNDRMNQIELHMRKYIAEILEPLDISCCFETDQELDKTTLSMELRKDFYLLFKEAINNIAKYSAATQVSIKWNKFDQEICLEIKDNGRGFDLNTIKQGNGLKNMAARAERMGGRLQIESNPGQGTLIKFRFPLT